jgi:enamine deaminase RidA (YjgF/YER057c/UK114 family)
LSGAGAASAQAAQAAPNVTGRVADAFSMGPLAGARVSAGSAGAVTGRDGRFALTLPKGTFRLVIEADGHLTEQVEVVVGDQPVTVEVLLLSRSQFREDVVVTAGVKPVPVAPSTIDVSPLAVRSIAGAAENIFRTVQTLPGVNATEDFTDHPKVVNGFSDLMVVAFGDGGRAPRSAVGMQSLPSGIAVEIEAIFELHPS